MLGHGGGSCSYIEASLWPPVACHQCTMGDHHVGTITESPLRTGTKLFDALDCQTSELGWIRPGVEGGQGQTANVDGLANQVSALWRSDWGRSRGYGEGARDMERWWLDCSFSFHRVLHGFTSLCSSPEYVGWTRPGGIMVMRFLPAVPVRAVAGDPACHPQIKCPTQNWSTQFSTQIWSKFEPR